MTKRPNLAASMKVVEQRAPDPLAFVEKAGPGSITAKPAAASRADMKRLLTPVAPDLHKRLKMLAVKQDTTLEAISRAALEAYLSQHDSKI